MSFDYQLFLGQLSFRSKRADIYEDMADSLNAGEYDSLSSYLLGQSAYCTEFKKPYLAVVYSEMAKRLTSVTAKGRFSIAARGIIPDSDIMLLSGFEEVGKLPDGLMELSKTIQKEAEIKAIYRGAVMAPSLSMAVVMGAGYFIGTNAFKPFASVAPIEKWPSDSVIAYQISMFIANWLTWIIVGLIAILIALAITLPRVTGEFRRKLDKIPALPWTMYREFRSNILLLTLAPLLKSGIALSKSLSILAETSDPWAGMYLNEMIRKLGDARSRDPSAIFTFGLFGKDAAWKLQGATKRSGMPDQAILSVAEKSYDKLLKRIKTQAAAISQAVLFIAGMTLIEIAGGLVHLGFALRDIVMAGN